MTAQYTVGVVMLFWLLMAPVAAVAAGAAYQAIETRRDRKRFPAPGRIINAGGADLHIREHGEGEPVVILEAGIAASSISWTYVQPEVAKLTRVISYDRAGFAWSGRCTQPRTPEQILLELRAVMQACRVTAPVVFVGHSFGALIGRLFASRYPEMIAGLVLVDSALLQDWAAPNESRSRTLQMGVRMARRGAMLCRAGVVRFALATLVAGRKQLPKAIARVSSSRGGQSTLERLVGEVRKLPEQHWPAIRSHWSSPTAFESMAEHLAVLPAVAREVAKHDSLGDLPLVVISGAHLTEEQLAEHREVARTSTQGEHVLAREGGH
ncbi:MAG TPA: alpha/beta hydrolase [Bryobacteraceae bacterium]|nr:alpha/beta hydrolase [Bryobacteraceae bacterium]